tara:strand:+ start:2075 stop:2425 length:351 start_codon:yes stop_codon:yes gene_type:complete
MSNLSVDQKILNRVEGYVERLGILREVYYKEEDPDQIAPPINISLGRKYAKVVAGASTHTFINMENGDILRATSNIQPRGVRGNIFDDDYGISCVGPFCTRAIKHKKAWPFTRRGN